MATDPETGKELGETTNVRPSLKITGLHIRGLKSIHSLDLPGDGLGWDGPIPDFVMVGGINGSGKSTLLEFLAIVFECMTISTGTAQITYFPPPKLPIPFEAKIDLLFSLPDLGVRFIRFLAGNKDFIEENTGDSWFGFQSLSPEVGGKALLVGERTVARHVFLNHVNLINHFSSNASGPAVVYLPSEGRNLIVPETTYKMPGNLTPSDKFVQRWQRPTEWKDSLLARLYALRWEDLNAKEEGRPEEATHFQSYQLAIDRFFEGRKRLKWTPKGELVVETKSGDIHDLSELSSGEKQVILFMGELLHRWRPGSLILIDEPELHLHESYQTRLWQSLVDWQKERGGQVLVATQSGHLFRIADSAMKVLLSRQSR